MGTMRTINIAYGENLINALDNEDFDSAVQDIKNNNGDVIGYNPTKDNIEELFQHIRGSFNFREVTQNELKQINDRL